MAFRANEPAEMTSLFEGMLASRIRPASPMLT
jgi:hypothetical protein